MLCTWGSTVLAPNVATLAAWSFRPHTFKPVCLWISMLGCIIVVACGLTSHTGRQEWKQEAGRQGGRQAGRQARGQAVREASSSYCLPKLLLKSNWSCASCSGCFGLGLPRASGQTEILVWRWRLERGCHHNSLKTHEQVVGAYFKLDPPLTDTCVHISLRLCTFTYTRLT